MNSNASAPPVIHWTEAGVACSARWRSESGHPPPRRVVIGDDRTSADDAYRFACAGTALLWRGDFHNAKQLLQALARRAERKPRQRAASATPVTVADSLAKSLANPSAEAFHLHRQAQAQRARTLAMLLLPLGGDYQVPLRRAPDLRDACAEAYGPPVGEASVVSLRELLGLVGAHEWRKQGVSVPALGEGERIHPHYGVFAPIRGEYVDLVAQVLMTEADQETVLAFDIGTGTGVLAALLARHGVARIVATDQDVRALDCARANIARLGLDERVEIIAADLFPDGRAALVVCNPPWLPGRPSSLIEHAVYDPDSRMLYGFIAGLAAHLSANGEGWLILSDLAEHLGLRSRDDLLAAFQAGGLTVIGRGDIRPRHPRATDPGDPLHAARAAEVTSLWRLAVRH